MGSTKKCRDEWLSKLGYIYPMELYGKLGLVDLYTHSKSSKTAEGGGGGGSQATYIQYIICVKK